MGDAGAQDGAREAAAVAAEQAEAAEQAAMTEVQSAAAAAMTVARDAARALATLATAVDRWQQTAATANVRRREVDKQLLEQMNRRIQEMEKRMEERTESRSEKELSNVFDRKTPSTLPITDKQGLNSVERKPQLEAGVKRSQPSFSDSDNHLSKYQRSHTDEGIPRESNPDSATQPTSSFSPALFSPPVPPVLDRRESALVAAVKCGRKADVENYLHMGVDPNFQDEEGNTLLHVAAKSTRGKILKHLLTHGRMPVDAVDSAGKTALHVAASSAKGGNSVSILLAHGADVNKRDAKGDTPLRCALRNGYEKIVEMLIKKGAVPNNDGEDRIRQDKTDGVQPQFQSQTLTSLFADDHLDPSSHVTTSLDYSSDETEILLE